MYGLRKTELKFTRFDGVKEVTHLLKVFLGDGMQVICFPSHPSLTKGARLLPEYKKIAYLHDVYQYALAAYGWGGLTAFRYINGVTTLSNSKAVSKHLQLKDDDILLFEMSEYGFGNGRNSEYDKNPSINSVHQDWQTGGICKPGFFVVKADKLDAIVVCVRGTFNLSDVLTDLICHYVPFRGGSAHQGILFSANRIYSFLLSKLKSFVATYRPKKLIITGHSLGAGVSSILTILLADHESEFRRLSGHGEKFKVMGFCYAPPPTVSKDLCEAYRNHIVGVVLKNDIVPRLSYGNFNDLKLFLGKAGELKGGNLIMPKIPELSYPPLDRLREQAKRSSVDRLYIPGRIYHLVHSNSESTYYKPGSYRSKATKSPYAIGSRINLHSREIQKSSKKRPHMELWKIDAFGMDEILTDPNCFKNHLPQLYDYGLLKAKIWAFEKGRFQMPKN
ncbi:Alpha/Beta hydrolase protein [Paraphysoderma sedebokerense]|nr:Alpha/Beta hydrolase protein [Paraphysoderma sedebokerense]